MTLTAVHAKGDPERSPVVQSGLVEVSLSVGIVRRPRANWWTWTTSEGHALSP